MQADRSEPQTPDPAPLALTPDETAARLRVCARTLDELRRAPWFPKPVVLGPRCFRFIAHEIDEALARRAPRLNDPRPEPVQLERSRRRPAAHQLQQGDA